MLVKDFLKNRNRAVITGTPSTSILEAMRLLVTNRISSLPVLDENGKLKGIVSDRDIFRSITVDNDAFKNLSVGDLMTTHVI
ncbi:MAG: CBS domain-containing protein, partial [candidate division Zixibacteria bacterium]|nr:CBS domain-containing protein [candidate division Zixibacteria bacterium]